MTFLNLFPDFFKNIFRYREYLKQSVARDLRRHYKRSFLGYFWSMLHPLLMMTILAVVFSNIMKFAIEDYAIFLFAGMLPWSYFNNSGLGSLGSIRANANIINQIPVPKYIFPLSLIFSNLVNFLLSLIPLFLIMLILGHTISSTVLFLPVVLIPLFFVTTGVSLTFAASNVFFEDTQHLATVFMQALYFLSPVLYGKEMLPEWITKWVFLNPMFSLIEFMRDIFYYGKTPSLEAYSISFASSLAVLAIGLWLFKKAENKFVYFI